MLDAYQAVRPCFEGCSLGFIPVQLAEEDNRSTFALAAAVSAIGFSAIPIEWPVRLCGAAALGGAAFVSYRFKWVKQYRQDIISALNQASCLVELYQGQVVYSLSKLLGVTACRIAASFQKNKRDEESENIRIVAAVCIGIYGAIVMVENGIPLNDWFWSVGWEAQVCAVVGSAALMLLAAEGYDKYFGDSGTQNDFLPAAPAKLPPPPTRRIKGCYK